MAHSSNAAHSMYGQTVSDQADTVVPMKVTAGYLSAFITSSAEESKTRLQHFWALASKTTLAEFQDARREFLDSIKDAPDFKTLRVRASEMQTLYTAYTMTDAGSSLLPQMGYHSAVREARGFLKAAKLQPTGKPVLNEAEQEQAKENKLEVEALKQITAENPELSRSERLEMLDARIELIREEQEAEAQKKALENLDKTTGKIIEKGTDYAQQLACHILDTLGFDVVLTARPAEETDAPM